MSTDPESLPFRVFKSKTEFDENSWTIYKAEPVAAVKWNTKCCCGGAKAGHKRFTAGHADWCDVAPSKAPPKCERCNWWLFDGDRHIPNDHPKYKCLILTSLVDP